VPATNELHAAEIEALARSAAHPQDASAAQGVRWIQTHISHVFLTGARVYKLRKAIRPGFLDFSTRTARNADCLREVRLNRRLAPDVYLGVAPVLARAAGVEVGAVSDTLDVDAEYVVVMRRLPDACDALSRLERGALTPAHLELVAGRISRFHAEHGLGVPAPFTPAQWLARIAAPMRANLASLAESAAAGVVDAREVERLAAATEAALVRHAPAFEHRRAQGRAVDGHGDLHLQHVWIEEERGAPKLSLIDCIEFSDELRQIDAASEVAFLAMDLRYRSAPALAELFVRRYAALRDDFGLYAVVDCFAAYRAAVRAKVAGMAARDGAIEHAQRARAADSAARHLALARELLRTCAPGPLVLVCGTVGTGKSTVADRIAALCGGAVISSDRTRKALAGLAPDVRGDVSLYGDAMTERVYAALRERAAPVLASGRAAILDATFARAAHRVAARAFAEKQGARALLVEVDCDEAVARERVAQRSQRGLDPSDAGVDLIAPSRARFEPTREWPAAEAIRIDTGREGWDLTTDQVARLMRGA
jgi:aminoglycoside phosphotransferase family enzyme/predicted kinase